MVDRIDVLSKLERLKVLVDEYMPIMHGGDEKRGRDLHEDIVQTYGEVEDLYRGIVGERRVTVEKLVFHTYFEAGFLSGWSSHAGQGRNELLKVIGKVRSGSNVTPMRATLYPGTPRVKLDVDPSPAEHLDRAPRPCLPDANFLEDLRGPVGVNTVTKTRDDGSTLNRACSFHVGRTDKALDVGLRANEIHEAPVPVSCDGV